MFNIVTYWESDSEQSRAATIKMLDNPKSCLKLLETLKIQIITVLWKSLESSPFCYTLVWRNQNFLYFFKKSWIIDIDCFLTYYQSSTFFCLFVSFCFVLKHSIRRNLSNKHIICSHFNSSMENSKDNTGWQTNKVLSKELLAKNLAHWHGV